MQELFLFGALSAKEVAMCMVAGALSIAAFEIVKMSRLWKHHDREEARAGT